MSDSSPAILVLDDEPSSVNLLRITLGMDYVVHTATDGETALSLLERHPDIGLALIDQRMPGMSGTEFIQKTIEPYPHLVRIILTGYTDVDSLIEAINAGSVYRYITKPWSKEELLMTVRRGLEAYELATENIRLQAELREANGLLRRENAQLRREVQGRYAFDEILGKSGALSRVLALVEKAVDSDTTVLVTGETGTGKELIARALHFNGPRAAAPFLSVNCADFTADMLGSELFGHNTAAAASSPPRARPSASTKSATARKRYRRGSYGSSTRVRFAASVTMPRLGSMYASSPQPIAISKTTFARDAFAKTSIIGSTCSPSTCRLYAIDWRTCRSWPSTCCRSSDRVGESRSGRSPRRPWRPCAATRSRATSASCRTSSSAPIRLPTKEPTSLPTSFPKRSAHVLPPSAARATRATCAAPWRATRPSSFGTRWSGTAATRRARPRASACRAVH